MISNPVQRPRRRLPHQYPPGRALFLTWHLHGSVPASRFPPPKNLSAGQAFVWLDRYLDTTRSGPMFLRDERVAAIVEQSLLRGTEELGHYDLHAYVLMANHVHLLASPRIAPSAFLKSLKGYTARMANRLLGRTGEAFWQAESYDHWVRNQGQHKRMVAYIENNPVKAGLVERPQDYRWSSAWKGWHEAER